MLPKDDTKWQQECYQRTIPSSNKNVIKGRYQVATGMLPKDDAKWQQKCYQRTIPSGNKNVTKGGFQVATRKSPERQQGCYQVAIARTSKNTACKNIASVATRASPNPPLHAGLLHVCARKPHRHATAPQAQKPLPPLLCRWDKGLLATGSYENDIKPASAQPPQASSQQPSEKMEEGHDVEGGKKVGDGQGPGGAEAMQEDGKEGQQQQQNQQSEGVHVAIKEQK
eukprot:scaffold98287_cov15-Tisochrysis_lutea.AAC.1